MAAGEQISGLHDRALGLVERAQEVERMPLLGRGPAATALLSEAMFLLVDMAAQVEALTPYLDEDVF